MLMSFDEEPESFVVPRTNRRNGFDVIGVEVGEDALVRGRGHLEASTNRAVKREKLTPEERDAIPIMRFLVERLLGQPAREDEPLEVGAQLPADHGAHRQRLDLAGVDVSGQPHPAVGTGHGGPELRLQEESQRRQEEVTDDGAGEDDGARQHRQRKDSPA